MSIIIPLTQGLITVIDEADLVLIGNNQWQATNTNGCFYARNREGFYLHRLIMSPPLDKVVDHVNGLTLDNRRANLRICSLSDNSRNAIVKSNNTTGIKGVCFHAAIKSGKPFQARIYDNNGKRISLGYYSSAEEAGQVYANKAKQLNLEFYCSGKRDHEPIRS